jgi:hypothetical protein
MAETTQPALWTLVVAAALSACGGSDKNGDDGDGDGADGATDGSDGGTGGDGGTDGGSDGGTDGGTDGGSDGGTDGGSDGSSDDGSGSGTGSEDPIIPPEFSKVYETSFEDVTVEDPHTLSWDMPHWIEYAAMHQEDGGTGDGEGGGRVWMEDTIVRTGQKSLGLELFDIEQSRRTELAIFPEDYLGAEHYVSLWLYLPEDWGLFEPDIDWDWYEMADVYSAGGAPYGALYIRNPDPNQEYFDVALGGRHEDHTQWSEPDVNLQIPKGRWFRVVYYVLRDREAGAAKLWFDGQLIGEVSGHPTQHSTNDTFQISIAKIYHERGDTVPHQLWIDDLALYGN